MIYAFLILLVPGALLNLLIVWSAVRREKAMRYGAEAEETAGFFFPGRFTRYAWNSGLAALTTGAIFKGVLDIYGTTNKLIAVYPAAGTILIGAAVLSFCMSYAAVRKMRKTQTA
jgi:hypothetical protein